MTREIDAAFLGKFLGLAASADELRGYLPPIHFVARLIEIASEYKALTGFPVPIATEGLNAKEVKGDADCRPAGMEGSRF